MMIQYNDDIMNTTDISLFHYEKELEKHFTFQYNDDLRYDDEMMMKRHHIV